jgi:ATP-dependent DNA helicase RecG
LAYTKGVGPQRAELLARLDLRTVRDVLFFFPRGYEDMSTVSAHTELREAAKVTLTGVVEECELRDLGGGRTILGVLVRQNDQYLRAVWFNQPFLQGKFPRGTGVMLSGRVRMRGGRWEMSHPQVACYDVDDGPPPGEILPIYSLTQGVSQAHMRRVVKQLVQTYTDEVEEVFPPAHLQRYNLLPIAQAVRQIHLPADMLQHELARRRFVFQELFILQLALALRRRRLTSDWTAPVLPLTAPIRARIERLIPYSLTEDQWRAVDEIAADMARTEPMNRLLQGDVGCGKTVVAMFAMLQTVAHGRQAVLMAPTELLARQHHQTLSRQLAHSRVRMGLLTGSLARRERQQLLDEIARGQIDIVVGTQAIAAAIRQEGVEFAQLGLVVIDEQHKFGVRQRAQLKGAGLAPHYLVMTATPIPRTVTLALFGDVDISSIREAPPGRQPVHTYLGQAEQRDRWWDFMRRKLREGRQGYVISPLVDEVESLSAASAEQMFERLACDELEEFRIDLVHGRMKAEQKEVALDKFARGETQVLVATSVIEVGIDVPNATLMTIESGERFGLAQLHQLRGRVRRGTSPGYVCVFAGAESDEANARLEAFRDMTDGFELAEADFRMRGPGDIFGTRQHGLPPLRIADLQRDTEILEEARAEAQQLVSEDPDLSAPEHARLRRMVLVRYEKALDLGDVG